MFNNKYLILLLIVLCLLLAASSLYLKSKYQSLQFELENNIRNHLTLQGSTNTCYGDKTIEYHLISLDGGKVWYACANNDSNGLAILGKAEEIYPGLSNCLIKYEQELQSLLSEVK